MLKFEISQQCNYEYFIFVYAVSLMIAIYCPKRVADLV